MRLCSLAGFALIFSSICGGADAQISPVIEPEAPLAVLNTHGSTSANVRAMPDPRSAIVQQLTAGTTDLRATGATGLFGDTRWIEVRRGATTGWVNARLVGRWPGTQPLQPFVDIDALAPTAGFAFTGAATTARTVTSFSECARRCAENETCAAIDYRAGDALCRIFDSALDLVPDVSTEAAAKPAKVPPGGWNIQSAVRFDRVPDQDIDGPSFRQSFAHGVDQCSLTCALEPKCAAFSYDSKRRLCFAFDRAASRIPRSGTASGIKLAEELPPGSALPVATSINSAERPAVQHGVGVSASPTADVGALSNALETVVAGAGRAAKYATVRMERRGNIVVTLDERPLGGPMHAAALPRELMGTVNSLAAVVGLSDRRILHLVFYSGPSSPAVILASSNYPTMDEATSAARILQHDLDELARLAGLGVDPLSLLKPLRR